MFIYNKQIYEKVLLNIKCHKEGLVKNLNKLTGTCYAHLCNYL